MEEVMAWGIEPLTFRLGFRLRKTSDTLTTLTQKTPQKQGVRERGGEVGRQYRGESGGGIYIVSNEEVTWPCDPALMECTLPGPIYHVMCMH